MRYEVVARRRPVAVSVPDAGPLRAPYAAVVGRDEVTLSSGSVTVTAVLDGAVALHVTTDGRTTTHRSRRSGRPEAPVDALALTLTGPQVTAFASEAGRWVARAGYDLTEDQRADPHTEAFVAGLAGSGPVGRFGQLGLRDLRVVTHADGSAYRPDGELLLTASSAGPGGFRSGHASVWALDPATYELEHRADLFSRRDGGVYGDHAVHLVRDGDRWLLAASTWGDFHPERRPVRTTLAESTADLTRGVHVLDAHDLPLTVPGSVGQWDPHLVRTDAGWLVGFVTARRYFRFGPALATGPSLDQLTVRAARTREREVEGTTLARLDGTWRVLASDKRRRAYPVLDLDLAEVGTLDAAYPSNIPWPTVVDDLLIGFDGTPYGGRVVGYGSHGDVIVQRATR